MAGLIYPDNLCLISEVREVELLCRKERNKWAKSHVTLQKERLFAKALHAQKFFSTYEIFGLRTVLCCKY